MKWAITLLTFVAILGPLATRAGAQTVSIKAVDNNTAGKIKANGDYTLGGKTLVSIELQARPAGGVKGRGGKMKAVIDTCGMTWIATVSNLPTGTYDVQAVLTYISAGATLYYYSDTYKSVKVK